MIPIIVAVVLAIVLWSVFSFDVILSWLLAINLVTFITYGYDKYRARSGGWRVSERVLLILALTGGSLGALLGMQFFRHKTSKTSFKRQLWLILAIQAALIIIYYLVIQ